ncbi:MAG: YiiG family protein [Hyphomicrobiaceae bacterium]|nr:YiiG family protein [Hyphomicrobiaceae bacterium]
MRRTPRRVFAVVLRALIATIPLIAATPTPSQADQSPTPKAPPSAKHAPATKSVSPERPAATRDAPASSHTDADRELNGRAKPTTSAAETGDLDAAISKSNAYIALMNRTIRAVDSWNRYTSWVNVKTGPTGRERYIDYGLYSLYDVRSEIDRARSATTAPPLDATLDAAMIRYIAAYETLAPLITAANGYYERRDYKSDKMKEGKALHASMVPAANEFIAARLQLDALMRDFKETIDRRALASIAAREGQSARWHIKNVMMAAQHIVEQLPSQKMARVDMTTFDSRLDDYAKAVRALDDFNVANPGKLSSFDSQPRSLLGKLRDYRDKLAHFKGDARRAGNFELTFIVSEYNMMVSMSEMAVRFSK